MSLSLRRFAAGGVLLLIAALLLAACGQTAPAQPSAAPAKPAAAAAPTTAPAAKDAAAPAAKEAAPKDAAKPAAAAGGANWAQEHEQWVKTTHEAAKKEGKVVVYGFWNPDLEATT